jgi:hypothetical protein
MFEKLKNKCKKDYVSRKELWDLTGGIIKGTTMTRLDSLNLGIDERHVIGGKTVYPIDALIKWLKNNTKRVK